MTNTGLIALDDKDHHITSGAADLVSIYSYLFNAKGEMILQLPPNKEVADKMVEYFKEKNLGAEEVSYVE